MFCKIKKGTYFVTFHRCLAISAISAAFCISEFLHCVRLNHCEKVKVDNKGKTERSPFPEVRPRPQISVRDGLCQEAKLKSSPSLLCNLGEYALTNVNLVQCD